MENDDAVEDIPVQDTDPMVNLQMDVERAIIDYVKSQAIMAQLPYNRGISNSLSYAITTYTESVELRIEALEAMANTGVCELQHATNRIESLNSFRTLDRLEIERQSENNDVLQSDLNDANRSIDIMREDWNSLNDTHRSALSVIDDQSRSIDAFTNSVNSCLVRIENLKNNLEKEKSKSEFLSKSDAAMISTVLEQDILIQELRAQVKKLTKTAIKQRAEV